MPSFGIEQLFFFVFSVLCIKTQHDGLRFRYPNQSCEGEPHLQRLPRYLPLHTKQIRGEWSVSPLSPAVDYCHLCFCKRKPIVFWKQHLFAAFLKICISKSSRKSFFLVSFYAFSYLCLLSGSVSSIARLKQFGGKA